MRWGTAAIDLQSGRHIAVHHFYMTVSLEIDTMRLL
jgi:hypothetical protein